MIAYFASAVMMANMDSQQINRAAQAIDSADALLITAGAGMGVDSGLPDFRGDTGFWRAYPAFEKLNLRFTDLANPEWFLKDPELAWGFYGQRLNLYRATLPHAGFGILRKWAQRLPKGASVFTSNVDEHFQRAGFPADTVTEVHGSIHWIQCRHPECASVSQAESIVVKVDETSMRAQQPLPACPKCHRLARPNVLMFNDWEWIGSRSREQAGRMNAWLRSISGKRLVIVECGAGTAIPTVRMFSEQTASFFSATLIRINIREPDVPAGQIAIQSGALDGLMAIDGAMKQGM